MKNIDIIREFFRYLIVGGSAFLIDLALLYVFKTYVFNSFGINGIYISTSIGFIGGLAYNYTMSIKYVFENAKANKRGKNFRAFLIFLSIGIIGLIITEIGMYLGVKVISINYLIVKIFVAGVVLIWNYAARKILIFL